MSMSIPREVAALQRLTVKELRAKYAVVFGEATNANNRGWLLCRIAWRIQANIEGDLSEQWLLVFSHGRACPRRCRMKKPTVKNKPRSTLPIVRCAIYTRQEHRGGLGAGVQLPGCPTRERGSVRPQPAARGLAPDSGALRRRRLHRRQHGPTPSWTRPWFSAKLNSTVDRRREILIQDVFKR